MRKRHIAMLAEEWVSERLNRWWDWGDWKEFPVLNHKRKWDEREKWKANEQFYSAELIQEALNEANEDGKASREERREQRKEVNKWIDCLPNSRTVAGNGMCRLLEPQTAGRANSEYVKISVSCAKWLVALHFIPIFARYLHCRLLLCAENEIKEREKKLVVM